MSSRTRKTNSPFTQRPIQAFLLVIGGSLCVTQLLWHQSVDENRDGQTSRAEAAVILVDINRAAHRELALLPNVGPVLAKRIVSDRSERGSYPSLYDLERVHGIGGKTLEHLSRYCVASEISFSLDR